MARKAYDQGEVQAVLDATDLVDLIAVDAAPGKRDGRHAHFHCPFHEDSDPSMIVDLRPRPFRKAAEYKCFSCGRGGDAIQYLRDSRGLSFPDAVEQLAASAGLEVGTVRQTRRWAEKTPEQRMHALFEDAHSFYRSKLTGEDSAEAAAARAVLDEAGVDWRHDETLGYAGRDRTELFAHLWSLKHRNGRYRHRAKMQVEDGTTRNVIDACGVIEPRSARRNIRLDRFEDRLTFLIRDSSGAAIGFSGHAMGNVKNPWLTTAATWRAREGGSYNPLAPTPVFDPKADLYGLFESKMDLQSFGRARIAGDPLETAQLRSAGYGGIVSPARPMPLHDAHCSALRQWGRRMFIEELHPEDVAALLAAAAAEERGDRKGATPAAERAEAIRESLEAKRAARRARRAAEAVAL